MRVETMKFAFCFYERDLILKCSACIAALSFICSFMLLLALSQLDRLFYIAVCVSSYRILLVCFDFVGLVSFEGSNVRSAMANHPFKVGEAAFYSSQRGGDVPCKVVAIHGDNKVSIDIREGAIKVDKLKKRTSEDKGQKRNPPVSDGPTDKRQRSEVSDSADGKLANGSANEIGETRSSPDRDDSQSPKGKLQRTEATGKDGKVASAGSAGGAEGTSPASGGTGGSANSGPASGGDDEGNGGQEVTHF